MEIATRKPAPQGQTGLAQGPRRRPGSSLLDRLTALLREFDLSWLPRDCRLEADRDRRSGVLRISVGPDAPLTRMIEVYRQERTGLVRFAASRLGRDHQLAEDLLHEVMRKICQNPPTMNEQGAELSYLYEAIRNQAATMGERSGRERTRREDAPDAAVHIPDPGGPFEDPVLFHLVVARALAGLPPRQRDLVELVDVRGLTVAQAAAELDIAVGTAKKHRFVALHRLKDDPELESLREKE